MNVIEKSLFAGIDVGSRTTKAVLFDGKTVLSSSVMDTGIAPRKSAEKAFQDVKEGAGVTDSQIQRIVGTGYGRISIGFAHETVTELTCHARGCHFIDETVRTVIDIGGQDSKIIRLDARGNMFDFVMNDKCAAGTGKFLEMAARALETDTECLDPVFETNAESPAEPCVINSMCAVFAESEIISLLSKGTPRASIVSGIHRAFAIRVGNMGKRLGLQEPVAFVGGVAKNRGLASALSEYLNLSFVHLSVDPQIMGALGAAVCAALSVNRHGRSPATPDHGNNVSISTVKEKESST